MKFIEWTNEELISILSNASGVESEISTGATDFFSPIEITLYRAIKIELESRGADELEIYLSLPRAAR